MRQVVRDQAGRPLYYLDEHMGRKNVRATSGLLLGWCENNQTRLANGTLIAQGEHPSMIFERCR